MEERNGGRERMEERIEGFSGRHGGGGRETEACDGDRERGDIPNYSDMQYCQLQPTALQVI